LWPVFCYSQAAIGRTSFLDRPSSRRFPVGTARHQHFRNLRLGLAAAVAKVFAHGFSAQTRPAKRRRAGMRLTRKLICLAPRRGRSFSSGERPLGCSRCTERVDAVSTPKWLPVIEKDIDGSHSLPLRIDRENQILGRYSARGPVARSLYLESAPMHLSISNWNRKSTSWQSITSLASRLVSTYKILSCCRISGRGADLRGPFYLLSNPSAIRRRPMLTRTICNQAFALKASRMRVMVVNESPRGTPWSFGKPYAGLLSML